VKEGLDLDIFEHLFDHRGPMPSLPQDVTAALTTLQARWGAAAPQRLGRGPGDGGVRGAEEIGAVVGALATVPLSVSLPASGTQAVPGRVVSTGFAALDAILGPGGLPRAASVALRGAASSGATTLALRIVAEAQAAGLIVAWLDLDRSFDPVEALARGVAPDWLAVATPATLDEGLSIAGSLLAGRSVDLLVMDLPERRDRGRGASRTELPGPSSPGVVARLGRLAALARRAGTLLVVIEPPGLAASLVSAVAAATSLRLELARRSWIRLGRDVVGQRTAVTIGRSRYGPPGRSAELRILYAEGGDRDACLQHEGLLREVFPGRQTTQPGCAPDGGPLPIVTHHASARGIGAHASAPPLLASPSPGARRAPLWLVPTGSGRGRRTPMDGQHRPGREPRGA
jgi:hypothetical protein